MYAHGCTCSVLATLQKLQELYYRIGDEKMNKHEPCTERLHLRMAAADKQMLQDKAAQMNMTVSEYLRALINNKRLVSAPELPQLAVQIIKIGTNVNQICNVARQCGVSQERIAETENHLAAIQDKLGDLITEIQDRKDRHRYKI